ncbi:hypothetical protein ANCDUO_12799, partial [Ancylostoma duodenale]
FGEVVNINLPRHKQTGKPRGFCFLCYRDQASTTLAVDNFNGITLLGRKLKVDYVEEYKVPKYREDADEDVKRLCEEGCAPKPIQRTGVKRKETIRNVRKKHHKKRKERKDHKENLVKVRKSSYVAVSENGNRLLEANWREEEIWREIRRREKETGDSVKKLAGPIYDHHFVPNRYR